MFAGILGDLTAAAAPTTEADPVGIYASLQAGAGVLIGDQPHIQISNTRHPLLIWPLLVGRSGAGRKGEATATAELFLRAADSVYSDICVTGLSSGEGLIERIRDEETTEKRLLVIEFEFSSVMARSRREGNTLAAVQRQAWEGRSLTVMNRKQLKASSSHIAIIGHVSPKEFRERLAATDLSGGTYNRYLPLYVERSKLLPFPEGVSEQAQIKLGKKLADRIEIARHVKSIRLDMKAKKLWGDQLYPELADVDDEDGAKAEFTRRAAAYCLRIAGLHAALDGRDLIGVPDLTAASAQVRYAIESAGFVLDRQARNPRLDRIRRAVDAAGEDGLARTAVSALFSRNLTKEVLDELLVKLTATGEYEQTQTATGGRPAITYRRVVLSSSFVPTSPPAPSSSPEDDPLFDKFWAAYPRQVAKPKATAAWTAAIGYGADPAAIIAAAERYASGCTGQDPKYIPYPANWLSNKGWLDQLAPRQTRREVTCPIHQVRHLEGAECRGCAADRKADVT